MTSIEQIARQYRGIRCNHIAQGLADLLRQAEANEVSYLAFALEGGLCRLENRMGREAAVAIHHVLVE